MSLSRSELQLVNPYPGSHSPCRESGTVFLWIAYLSSAALFFLAHFAIGLKAPLWFDESWTGALASVDGFDQLVHQMHEEAGGPTYYTFIWIWAHIFGNTNISLHSANFVIASACPFVAWVGLRKSRPLLAPVWAVLLAIWGPGMAQSGFARCYPLLFCVAIATTVAYICLLDQPTLFRSCVWSLLGSFLVLTHYDSGILIAVQAIFFVAVCRRKVLRMWPAALMFLPTSAWILWNFHRLNLMSSPVTTWYHVVSWDGLPFIISYLIGASLPVMLLAVGCALATHLLIRFRMTDEEFRRFNDRGVLLTGTVAIASLSVFIAIAMLRPIFTLRYLVPFEPGFALVISFWMTKICSCNKERLGLMLCAMIAVSCIYWTGPLPLQERLMNFEVASDWISQSKPSKLVFLWDNPAAVTVAEDQMDIVGGFFLHRAGFLTQIESVYPAVGTDMNPQVRERVGNKGSLIWIYDTWVDSTTATLHPPAVDGFDKELECKDFGELRIGIFACRPKTLQKSKSEIDE